MSSSKLSAIAVDDEPRALEVIQLHTAKIPFLEIKATFRRPLPAVDYLRQEPCDLLFLDINMPDLSGLQVRELIGPGPEIIFTTAYSEFAVESYEQNALDYLLKPIRFERFLKAIYKAQKKSPQVEAPTPPARQYIFVKSGTTHVRLDIGQIHYIEKDGNYVFFHTEEKRIISRLTVKQLLELLPEETFQQIHKSYIVSLLHIDSLDHQQVIVRGKALPLTARYRQVLLERIK